MPIYEYECGLCRRSFEALVTHADQASQTACPFCGNKDVQKLISPTSIIRSSARQQSDRTGALGKVDPTKPQEVANHFREHGSRFGDSGFRGKKAWREGVERVSKGGPTLKDK
jgi:putative FmdB family regulatory protein